MDRRLQHGMQAARRLVTVARLRLLGTVAAAHQDQLGILEAELQPDLPGAMTRALVIRMALEQIALTRHGVTETSQLLAQVDSLRLLQQATTG